MPMCDWSSDVCSSDLGQLRGGLGTRPCRFRCSKSCCGPWHLPAPLGLNQEDPKGFLCAGIHAPEPLPPSSSRLCQRTQSRLFSDCRLLQEAFPATLSQLCDSGSALWDLDGNQAWVRSPRCFQNADSWPHCKPTMLKVRVDTGQKWELRRCILNKLFR